MSASMYVQRPPVETERHYVGGRLRRLLARWLFDSDGTSPAHGSIARHSHAHHWLLGAYASAQFWTGPDADEDRAELQTLLDLIDQHGGAEVIIER